MNDLEDVAMAALDAAEAADAEQSQGDPSNGADDTNPQGDGDDNASTTNNAETENGQGEQDQGAGGESSGDGDEKSGENDEKSSETEQKPNENGEKTPENDENGAKNDKKELTDEEFEKLAKERGYFKQEQKPQPQQQERKPLNLPCPQEIDQKQWDSLPEINKVIYTNLPAIKVRGMSGDEEEPREYIIKTPTQLPDDFRFASDKEKTLFDDAIATQSRRADALEQRITQFYQQEAKQRESRMVIDAIDRLQANGVIPKIVAKNGTKEFDTDPGVVAANNILAFWKQRNDAGVNISIDDAAIIYKSTHPDEFKATPPVAKGDNERKSVASKIGGGRKSADNASNKKGYQRKYWRPGMSTEEVAELAMEDLD